MPVEDSLSPRPAGIFCNCRITHRDLCYFSGDIRRFRKFRIENNTYDEHWYFRNLCKQFSGLFLNSCQIFAFFTCTVGMLITGRLYFIIKNISDTLLKYDLAFNISQPFPWFLGNLQNYLFIFNVTLIIDN